MKKYIKFLCGLILVSVSFLFISCGKKAETIYKLEASDFLFTVGEQKIELVITDDSVKFKDSIKKEDIEAEQRLDGKLIKDVEYVTDKKIYVTFSGDCTEAYERETTTIDESNGLIIVNNTGLNIFCNLACYVPVSKPYILTEICSEEIADDIKSYSSTFKLYGGFFDSVSASDISILNGTGLLTCNLSNDQLTIDIEGFVGETLEDEYPEVELLKSSNSIECLFTVTIGLAGYFE